MTGVVAVALVVAACAPAEVGGTTTTSTIQPTTTASTEPSTSTSITVAPLPVGGQLVKLDPVTLEPVPGLQPIPHGEDSWSLTSSDGEWIVVYDWNEVTPVKVATWQTTGSFEISWHSARVIESERLYTYDDVSGRLRAVDLLTGQESLLPGRWRTGLWMRDDLQVISGGRIAALAANSEDVAPEYLVHWLEPTTGETGEIPIGPIENVTEETGIFDGDYEVPEWDSPGVAWSDDRLYIVHADGPEVTVADFDTGEVETHTIDTTTWLDRLFAFWMPSALAKGPSLGTYSSAALSPDGRYLFISGNRYDVDQDADGNLVEENQPLGLTVVDTDTWAVVDQPDIPFQFVRNANGMVIGVNNRSISPWVDEIYTLSMGESGAVAYQGPVTVEDGTCQPTLSGSLICSEYVDAMSQRLRLVDPAKDESTIGSNIGIEDYVEPNGVLHDWSPVGRS